MFREWRLAIRRAGGWEPCTGLVDWESKRLMLRQPGPGFTAGGRTPAVMADPSYPYSLLRIYFRPLRIELDPENKAIREIEFEYFHRKEPCED
ncbi:MAG: hypothetical protein V1913_18040 [Fibrobacterota bacterium]